MAKKIIRKKKVASNVAVPTKRKVVKRKKPTNVVVLEDWLLAKVLSEKETKEVYDSWENAFGKIKVEFFRTTYSDLVDIYFTYGKKHRARTEKRFQESIAKEVFFD